MGQGKNKAVAADPALQDLDTEDDSDDRLLEQHPLDAVGARKRPVSAFVISVHFLQCR